ncbi:MAG: HK97 gp10 family phage protein [Nitriliruptoraceae bacterium]
MSSSLELDAEVRHDLEELVDRGVAAIVAALETAAHELRETHIPAEAPRGATGHLASDWHEREHDPLTRVVFPGPEAWYAHIVAYGRAAVRPVGSKALTIGEEYRAWAGPATPDPFHERAIAATEQGADRMLDDALAAQGI